MAHETITLDVDGAPVLFEIRPTAGQGGLQLWANGCVIASARAAGLSAYGRVGLIELFREAVRAGRVKKSGRGADKPRSVVVSDVRAYLYLPGPDDSLSTIMLHRLNGEGWVCDRCEADRCEHVALFEQQQDPGRSRNGHGPTLAPLSPARGAGA